MLIFETKASIRAKEVRVMKLRDNLQRKNNEIKEDENKNFAVKKEYALQQKSNTKKLVQANYDRTTWWKSKASGATDQEFLDLVY